MSIFPSLHKNSYPPDSFMPNNKAHKQLEITEISILLREMRLEATPEADFEERFMTDFRERMAREAVCRPARVLLWEHISLIIDNLGRRRLAWGAASVSACAVALGVLVWQQEVSPGLRPAEARMASAYRSEEITQPLMPAEAVAGAAVRTTVTHRSARSYSDAMMAAFGGEGSTYPAPPYAGMPPENMSQGYFFNEPSAALLTPAQPLLPEAPLPISH